MARPSPGDVEDMKVQPSSTQPTNGTVVSRDGLSLAYLERGDVVPVVLLHALSANSELNWVAPGIADHLAASNLRVISLDFRGHGRSEQPTEASAYSLESLVDDTVDLIVGLELGACHVVGYSLGALVAAHVAASGSIPLRSVVLAGIGNATVTFETQPPELVDAIVEGLHATDPEAIAHPAAKMFRAQVDAWGAEPRAMAAIIRDLQVPHPLNLAAVDVPVLVLNGEGDAPPSEIAGQIPGAIVATVAGDHMSAPQDPEFAEAVARFLLDH